MRRGLGRFLRGFKREKRFGGMMFMLFVVGKIKVIVVFLVLLVFLEVSVSVFTEGLRFPLDK